MCPFCVVPIKEGLIHKVDPLSLNKNGKWVMLLDNNFFSCKEWKQNIEILKSYNQPIAFTQGLDLRIMTNEMAKSLSSLKIKQVYVAWDNYKDKDIVLSGLKRLTKYVKPYKVTCYVLVGFENKNIIDTDLERVETLRQLGVNPFAMGYVDFNNPNYKKTQEVKDFCRWVNMKSIFKSVKWKNYGRRT